MNERIYCALKKAGSFIAFLMLLLCCQESLAQQQVNVQGTVVDSSGGLPHVNIAVVGQKQRLISDGIGRFQVTVASDAVLEFTYAGYLKKLVPISQQQLKDGKAVVLVTMAPVPKDLGEVTVVGFGGTQKKASLVSSITSISPRELQGPTGNLTNALAGKVAGMISFQTSGEPGNGTDNSTFYIRGLSTFGTGKRDPLILIDGVESTPTDMARLQADDIADFSVLKDAAAASVYGARGANGVVLINTKMGKEGVAKFSVRAETRVSSNTRNFQFADNITYMNLANEATLTRSPNNGTSVLYTQNKINHTLAGHDSYLYPNNNWIDQLIKKYTINQSYNMNISGGTQRARYYVAGTFGSDNGVLKGDPINSFNSNIKLNKYSLRSNVNLNITKSTELIIRMYGQFDDYNGPIGGGAGIFDKAMRANPVMFPAVYPKSMVPHVEHPLFGSAQTQAGGQLTSTLYTNPYAEMVKGYRVYKTSNVQPQFELKQNLNALTKGLSFRSMAYLRRYSFYAVNRAYNPFFYTSVINPDDQSYKVRVLNDGSATSIGTAGTEYLGYTEDGKVVDSRLWLEGSLNYNRTFADKHNVGGSLISYLSSYETGNAGGGDRFVAPEKPGPVGSVYLWL